MNDSPRSPESAQQRRVRERLQQGFRELTAGRPARAAAAARGVLARLPECVEAHFLVGLAALELKDRRTAIAAFGSVTRLDPAHAAAWAQLARALLGAGQLGRGEAALARAVALDPRDPVVCDLLGSCHAQLGDQRAAREWYRRAVAAAPERVAFRVNLANAEIFLGAPDAAAAELQQALQRDPDNAQAHWLSSTVRRAADRRHVETLVRLIARVESRSDPAPQSLAFLYYALGKEFEDLREWPRAFAAFRRGAAARRAVIDFDEAAEVAAYQALERLHTRDWLAAGPAGDPDPAPIFVIGQPRTGTTLVERIISSHSAVHSAGELQQFGLAVRRLTAYQGTPRFSAALFEAAALLDPVTLGQAYLQAAAPFRGTRPRFVDKLPSNFLFLPLILKALPGARIVHLVRDPLDACFASFKQLFADAYPHSYRLDELGRHHIRYHRLLQAWRTRFPGRFHEVRYEDIVTHTEREARALLEYLGLDWEPACLAFHEQPGAVVTASAVQVREPAHTRSVGRWRRYAQELEPLRRLLADAGIATE